MVAAGPIHQAGGNLGVAERPPLIDPQDLWPLGVFRGPEKMEPVLTE